MVDCPYRLEDVLELDGAADVLLLAAVGGRLHREGHPRADRDEGQRQPLVLHARDGRAGHPAAELGQEDAQLPEKEAQAEQEEGLGQQQGQPLPHDHGCLQLPVLAVQCCQVIHFGNAKVQSTFDLDLKSVFFQEKSLLN